MSNSVQQGIEMAGGQYLSFHLGGEMYGTDILRVVEIKGWEPVRPLPDTPEYVKGVLDLRGTIVPIIDLRQRFSLPHAEYTPTTVTIIFSVEAGEHQYVMGAVVDGVSDVLEIDSDEIRAAPNLGARINTRYISGVVRRDSGMVILLDTDRLLDPEELGVPAERL